MFELIHYFHVCGLIALHFGNNGEDVMDDVMIDDDGSRASPTLVLSVILNNEINNLSSLSLQ